PLFNFAFLAFFSLQHLGTQLFLLSCPFCLPEGSKTDESVYCWLLKSADLLSYHANTVAYLQWSLTDSDERLNMPVIRMTLFTPAITGINI
ncbi:hypothetical protein, partial [Providencia sp. wls1948]|uniref:hypothetical protein n=1 Tax=Providencia sp. wls1948 TaxID=2675149 RepID=UPI001E50EE52